MIIPARIDLNCDLGELEGDDGLDLDLAILPWIHSANVACGAHAGSPERMQLLASACKATGAAFGAHPGYPDRENFGRRMISMTKTQIREMLTEQLHLSLCVANSAGIPLAHVKPHGALYNLAAVDIEVAMAIAETVQSLAPQALLFGLSGSCLIEAGHRLNLKTRSEVFADRNYQSDGTLVPREHFDAVLHDADMVIQRAVSMIRRQEVTSLEGTPIALKAETI
ncbi:MAG: 5-oxoprolinase subunit PxpA, partial [Planctomycetaceae bacterium]